jgi:hypothetical protein
MDMDVSNGRITELPADLDVLVELSHEGAKRSSVITAASDISHPIRLWPLSG